MRIDTLKIEMILAERELTKTAFANICGISRQNISTIMFRLRQESRPQRTFTNTQNAIRALKATRREKTR